MCAPSGFEAKSRFELGSGFELKFYTTTFKELRIVCVCVCVCACVCVCVCACVIRCLVDEACVRVSFDVWLTKQTTMHIQSNIIEIQHTPISVKTNATADALKKRRLQETADAPNPTSLRSSIPRYRITNSIETQHLSLQSRNR